MGITSHIYLNPKLVIEQLSLLARGLEAFLAWLISDDEYARTWPCMFSPLASWETSVTSTSIPYHCTALKREAQL